MNTSDLITKVREELLLLGLEDEIPVPEAMVFEEEIRAAGFEPWKFVSDILRELCAKRILLFSRGVWSADSPDPVSRDEADRLLTDQKWFQYRLDEDDEERLYYVNIDNLRPDFPLPKEWQES